MLPAFFNFGNFEQAELWIAVFRFYHYDIFRLKCLSPLNQLLQSQIAICKKEKLATGSMEGGVYDLLD